MCWLNAAGIVTDVPYQLAVDGVVRYVVVLGVGQPVQPDLALGCTVQAAMGEGVPVLITYQSMLKARRRSFSITIRSWW